MNETDLWKYIRSTKQVIPNPITPPIEHIGKTITITEEKIEFMMENSSQGMKTKMKLRPNGNTLL